MKHLKITSILLSVAMCMSFIMTPVTSVADETEAPEETTEATEATETKETEETEETTKETEKATEPSESEESEPTEESVPETSKETESSEETVPEESKEAEPAPSDEQEPEKETPAPEEPKSDSASQSPKNDEDPVSGKCGKNLTWSYSVSEWGGSLTIEGSGDMYNYASADKTPWYVYREELHYISFSNDVTSIGDYAFCDANFYSVRLPAKAKKIGKYAFKNQRHLSSAELPGTLTTIGEGAFENSILNDLAIPNSVTSIGKRAFAQTWLRYVTIPGSVKTVPESLFDGCDLIKVTFLNGVTTINKAFAGCTYLKSVTIPKSVTVIKEGAFSECSALKDVEYGGTESDWKKIKIGDSNDYLLNAERHYSAYAASGKYGDNISWTLDNSGKLTVSGTGEMPDENHMLSSWKYLKDSVKTAVIENGITSLPKELFQDHTNLTSIVIADTVESIGEDCFYNCTKLTSVKLPDGLKKLGRYAFQNCIALKSIKLPKGLTTLENATFYACKSLTSLEIPEGVTVIESFALANCKSLTYLYIPKSVTDYGISLIDGSYELNDIHYGGTHEDYLKINKTYYNVALSYCGIYFSDGTYSPCNKKVNTLKLKTKTAKVKYKKLKKKAQTVSRSKVLNVSNPEGVLTYTLVSVKKSKYKKYFKINPDTGAVTVKKKLKKGTYKIKVRVKVSGNPYYKSMTKTVTFKIKVK